MQPSLEEGGKQQQPLMHAIGPHGHRCSNCPKIASPSKVNSIPQMLFTTIPQRKCPRTRKGLQSECPACRYSCSRSFLANIESSGTTASVSRANDLISQQRVLVLRDSPRDQVMNFREASGRPVSVPFCAQGFMEG